MHKTLFVFNNYDLYIQMKKLPVWGRTSGFEVTKMVQDGLSAYRELEKEHYDLVISEIRIIGLDGLQLWRKAKEHDLCSHFVLCSEFPDFHYARQGIILGVFDYLVVPFQEKDLLDLFERIRKELFVHEKEDQIKLEKISEMFKREEIGIEQRVLGRLEEIYRQHGDTFEADKDVRELYEVVIDEIFSRHDWLELYLEKESFYTVHGISESDEGAYRTYYEEQMKGLFREFYLLYPETEDEQLKKIMLFMLRHPEEDLKQTTLAKRLYLNSSYLSTVFTAKTGQKYIDYLTNLKLKRAGVLLRSSNVKVADLAELLGYKDTAYFSRLFKKQYKMTPTEYRIPEGYDFNI